MFNRKEMPHRPSKKGQMLKKITVMTCLGLSLTFPTVFAAEGDGDLEKIFHVYVDGKHVGKVNDKKTIQTLMNTKVEKKETEFKDFLLDIGEQVSLIPERVFNPSYNNREVSSYLKDELSVKAEAVELKIGGNRVGYFKSKEEAKQALKAYKEKYVDKKILEKLAPEDTESEQTGHELQALVNEQQDTDNLGIGDSIITDVILSEKVSLSDQKATPSNILTEKQGLKKLEKGTLADKVHKVKKGETLVEIAKTYDLSLDKLLELNDGLKESSVLQIDQEIHVKDYKPFVDVIVKKEKKVEETIDYETKVIKSDELYKGDKKVKQNGQEGKKVVHYALQERNGAIADRKVAQKEVTKEPVKKIIVKGTKVIPSRGTGNLRWPTVGGYVSSHVGMRWGSMHKGMDIAGPSNRSILAADNGTVVSAGWSGGYGNKIVIDHNNGMRTVYAHLSSIGVSPGQTIEKGRKIGVMGSTGDSTGLHLHFEVYKNGSLQHPSNYLH
ncbi:peptidoglycan DD-metalloendopeptidase family protein [Lentibacillus cibarius]|nr:peptidoglycan DD-metalloendopeptidase family protein [Lentibacillus cibarius]